MSHIEADSATHVARVLLLVNEFTRNGQPALDGLTKIAKLDFLLRYPSVLQRLNAIVGVESHVSVSPRQIEVDAVEQPMIRYKYGPWDNRYYTIIGSLVGLGLASYEQGRGAIALRVTKFGEDMASSLSAEEAWQLSARRVAFLHEHYDETGNRLKELIYGSFPDLTDLRLGADIPSNLGSTLD